MLGISSEFCKRIICRFIFFHGKIMHDSLLNYSGSFNPNGIPLGTTRVSNLNISLNFPENNQETPSRADSVMTHFPWSKLFCFFC